MSRTVTSLNVLATAMLALLLASARCVSQVPTPAALATWPEGVFLENRGQWPSAVQFVARMGSIRLVVTADDLRFVEPGDALDSERVVCVRLGGRGDWQLSGENVVTTRWSFLLGSKPNPGGTGIRGYRSLRLIDGGRTVTLSSTGSQVRIRPHAAQAVAAWPTSQDVRVEPGSPAAAVAATGRISPAASTTGSRPRAAIEPWDVEVIPAPDSIVLDVNQATLVGGSETEGFSVLARAADGSFIAAGESQSADFPTTPGAFDGTFAGGSGTFPGDAVVVRFNPSFEVEWATYLGGEQNETIQAIEILPDGAIVVAGWTFSMAFPITPGAQQPTKGLIAMAGFVTRLDSTGSHVEASTYLGGITTGLDEVRAMDRLQDGRLVVGVDAQATNLPVTTTVLLPSVQGGHPNGYLAILDPESLLIDVAAYFGGSEGATLYDVAALRDDSILVGGTTLSDDLPLSSAAYQPLNNDGDGFLLVLNQDLDAALAGTYLGGPEFDALTEVAVGPDGDVYAAGQTSELATTPGAFQANIMGAVDGFVARLSPDLTQARYVTLLGSEINDHPEDLAVDSAGRAHVVGYTLGSHFPTTKGALQEVKPNGAEAMTISRLAPMGEALSYSTYVGTSALGEQVVATALALAPDSSILVAGGTTSAVGQPFSGLGPVNGSNDAEVVRLSLLPERVWRLAAPQHNPSSGPVMSLSGAPVLGEAALDIECLGAPAAASGLLFLSGAIQDPPLVVKGQSLLVSPVDLLAVLPVSSDELGFASLRLRIPVDPVLAGLSVAAQYAWPGGGQALLSDGLLMQVAE